MQRDINSIAREYCRRSRLIRKALVSARARSSATRVELIREEPRERFARAVLDRLDGSVLRYSMRLELLQIANQIGLTRFDACLIIAQVQHRTRHATPGRPVARDIARHIESLPISNRIAQFAPYVLAGFIQLCIFAGVWAMVS